MMLTCDTNTAAGTEDRSEDLSLKRMTGLKVSLTVNEKLNHVEQYYLVI